MASAPMARAAAGGDATAAPGVTETTDSRDFSTCSDDMVRNAVEGTRGSARRRGPHDALARTDQLLGHLEELNLDDRGTQKPPAEVGHELTEIGAELSPRAQTRLAECKTVQECVDGIFDVQEELLAACAWAARIDAGWEMPPLARAS